MRASKENHHQLLTILLLFLLGFLFSPLLPSHAVTQTWPANSSFCPTNEAYCVTVPDALTTAGTGPYGGISYFSDHINFTGAYLGTSANSSNFETFGLGKFTSASPSLMGISNTLVTTTLSRGNETYYYTTAYPSSVTINFTTIPASNYLTTLSSFNAETAPAILLNSSCTCMTVNAGETSLTTIAFNVVQVSPAPGGGGGSGGTTQSLTTTSVSTAQYGNSLSISPVTLTMQPDTSQIATVLIDNSQNSGYLSINSINFTSPSGITITRNFPLPFTVKSFGTANIELNVSASNIKSGPYVSNVNVGYTLGGSVTLSDTFQVTVNIGQPSNPFGFLTSSIGIAIIIAIIIASIVGALVKKKMDEG